jgi:muramoyltetrapeptide carboxypeptidase
VNRKAIKPIALKSGDTVAVVAPAAAIEREHLERGVNVLASMGFRVKVSERALARSGILAGDDRERAAELQACFADPGVKAIFSARGGYGCGRLLPLLDFKAIARTPKVFVGFSDETFLLNALLDLAGMVSFHGPMVAMDFARGLTPRSLDHMQRLLKGELAGFELEARESVHPGTADGEVIGGCLSVLVATIGTPYAPKFDGRILFLEDTGEKAYRIDRMLVQLRQAGALARVAGIVFGAIRAIDGDESENRLIARFVAEQTAGLGCPVIYGIEAGHGTENFTIPFGVPARIDSAARRIVFTETAVASR